MNELLNLSWFSGDVNGHMAPVINTIGIVASCVISLVGFMIVVSTILKNSMHGLYAVSPKFWDRVYEVKQADLRAASGNQSNQISKLIGNITSFGLSLLPNVKALTDFEETQMDAKHYFMRAIPMMCVALFIGVFIYLGYPAQVAGKFSEFGTAAIDMVMDNVNPEAIVESIPEQLALLKYQTDNAASDTDKVANEVARKAINALVGTAAMHGDMTKEAKQECLVAIEDEAIKLANSVYAQYADASMYKWSVTSSVSETGPRTFSRQNGVADSNGVVVFNDSIDVSTLPMGVTFDTSNWSVYWTITFTPIAQKQTSKVSGIRLNVPNSRASVNTGSRTITFDFSNAGAEISAATDKIITDGSGNRYRITAAGKTSFTVTAVDSKTDVSLSKIFTVSSGLWYYGPNNSKCKVTSITIDGSELKMETDTGKTYNFGEDPTGE